MKKSLKIAGIALAIIALVSNFHNALFTFYGIKSNNLAGQVWAQSTSTSTNGTSTGGSTSGGGTGGGTGGEGSSTDDLFWDDKEVGCYVEKITSIPVKTYANAGSTASIGFTGNNVASVSLGSQGTFTQENHYVAIFTPGTKITCPVSPGFCWSTDCSYAPGTKAEYVFYNGQRIDASTGGAH
jgi:hypothetical protein